MAAKLATERDNYLAVARPGNTCLLCSGPLNVAGKHPSLIQLTEKEEVVRKDFCPTCWSRLGEEQYFSFWVTKRAAALSPEQRRLQKSERNEALWRLFAALYSTEETSEESADLAPQLFLLAHLLMKYRVLVYTGRTPERRLAFLHPKLGESFVIADLALDSADFVSMKGSLEQQAADLIHGAIEPEPVSA